jgi:hypothetical protein
MNPQKLEESLSIISSQLSDIKLEQSQIKLRLDRVETLGEFDEDTLHGQVPSTQGSASFTPRQQQQGSSPAAGIPSGFASSTAEVHIERGYENIKDSLNKVRLPDELRVYDSKTGIARDNHPAVNILSKCARYCETALKQLSIIVTKHESRVEIDSGDLQKLFTVLQAQIVHLQGEYAGLLVKSKFDDQTANLFKCLEKNQSAFTEQSLQNLRCAAEITAASSRNSASSRGRGNPNYFNRGPRGRGRGNSGFQDNYQQFTNRDFPSRRYNPTAPQRTGSSNNQDHE